MINYSILIITTKLPSIEWCDNIYNNIFFFHNLLSQKYVYIMCFYFDILLSHVCTCMAIAIPASCFINKQTIILLS